tara:strand:+ start:1287 stop:1634 length:348 start_codon:yes stop_codon:yes gene_type:complete
MPKGNSSQQKLTHQIFKRLNENVEEYTERIGERIGLTLDVRKRINEAFKEFHGVARSPHGRWVDIVYTAANTYDIKISNPKIAHIIKEEFGVKTYPRMSVWTQQQRERLTQHLVD